jgi:hypothetical protein
MRTSSSATSLRLCVRRPKASPASLTAAVVTKPPQLAEARARARARSLSRHQARLTNRRPERTYSQPCARLPLTAASRHDRNLEGMQKADRPSCREPSVVTLRRPHQRSFVLGSLPMLSVPVPVRDPRVLMRVTESWARLRLTIGRKFSCDSAAGQLARTFFGFATYAMNLATRSVHPLDPIPKSPRLLNSLFILLFRAPFRAVASRSAKAPTSLRNL